MSSLTWIKQGVGYFPGVVTSGVIVAPGSQDAILIDTGLDGEAGRRLRRGLTEAGLTLKAIINTHSHADHFGGNRWLLARETCEVYAPELEEALIRHPELEPFYLFGGAAPPDWMQNRFFQAEPSPVHHVLQPGQQQVAGVTVDVVPLPGHSLRQVGIAYDGVLFAADSFYGMEALAKHACPFLVDADATRQSWDALEQRPESYYVPGHGSLLTRDELPATLAANRDKLDRLEAAVVAAAAGGCEEGELVRRVMAAAGLTMQAESFYYLNRAPLLALLVSLRRHGRLVSRLDGLTVIWETVAEQEKGG